MLPAVNPLKQILLASSSQSLLDRNSNLLMRRGFRLFKATSGQEALRIHGENRLDLILADMQLGDMGGDLFCSRVHAAGGGGASVILICHDTPDHLQRAALCRAAATILRPVDPLKLVETVGRFLATEMVRSKRVDLKVDVRVAERASGAEFDCRSRDISRSGICLESTAEIEQGRSITFSFTVPGGSQLELEGVVMRSMGVEGGKQYGIQFINLCGSSSRQLDSCLARLGA